MAQPAFALPFTDADLTGANEIVFDVSAGSGPYTATVALPVAGAGLPYGYYNVKTGSTSPTYSLTKAVIAAMNTAYGSSVFTAAQSSTTSGMPGVLRFDCSDGPWEFLWATGGASNPFNPAWLGFDAADVSSALDQIEATWPPGRLFLPPRSQWLLAMPGRIIKLAARTLTGISEVREIATGAAKYRIKIPQLTPARVLLSAASHSDFYTAIPDMVQDDPNTPFEALWRYMGTRAPLRYWPDRDTVGTYTDLDVTEQELLQEFMAVVTDPHETPNPLQDIDLMAQLYVG